MSIAIFTDNDFGKTNGVTTTLKSVLRHTPADLRVRIYTLSDLELDEPDYLALKASGVPIPFYGEMRMYMPRLRRFRQHLVADGVRVLHVTTPGPAGLAARYFAASGGHPLIGSFHTNLSEYTALLSGSQTLGRLMSTYTRWFYGACETVLVPSADTAERLAGRGWARAQLSLWQRGVDTAMFSPARRSSALRHRWRVSDDRPAVLYAGRVSREKGLDLLAPLTALLNEYNIAHRFIIVGDGPIRRELELQCPEAVFTGRLSHDEVAVAMASADIFFFPSGTDTAGNVVLEAQASGLPVVVTDTGGPKENMDDRVTGYVCRKADAEDFCLRVTQLLRDASRHRAMATAARTFAERRSWPMSLSPLYSLYRSALSAAIRTANTPIVVSTGSAGAASGV